MDEGMKELMADEIVVSGDRSSWQVHFNGSTQSFSTKAEARAHAHGLGRANPGVAIVTGPPPEPMAAAPVEPAPAPEHVVAPVRAIFDPRAVAVSADGFAGPDALGRAVIVTPGSAAPPSWDGARRIALSTEDLSSAATLQTIREVFAARTRVVFELPLDAVPPAPVSVTDAPWGRSPRFEFVAENAWALLFANAADCRGSHPRFAPAEEAIVRGATLLATAEGDVLLPSGTPAFIDGGPLDLARGSLVAPATMVPLVVVEQGSFEPLRTPEVRAELAPDQLAAVTTPTMAARIIAPAGSGKTRVLTERARLLRASGIPGPAMSLVSFNTRAQGEMAERTTDVSGLRITTLNALGLAITNGTRGFLATGPERRTIDERDVRAILADLVDPPKIRNVDPLASYLEALSLVRLGLQDPAAVEESFNGEVPDFAEAFSKYRSVLAERNLLDYDEQIYRAIEILMANPNARLHNQRLARVLLVDEFQDLNPAHILLLRLLAAPRLDLYGVGDDDQTIYGFSGASPTWLVEFSSVVPTAVSHALEVNYRCPPAVVAAASNALTHTSIRVPKTIRHAPNAVHDAAALDVRLDPSPTTATVAAVGERLAAGAAPSEVMVLARVNALLDPVAVGLRAAGVPVNADVRSHLLEGTGIKSALAWIALATSGDRLRRGDLQLALQRPSRGLPPTIREWVLEKTSVEELEHLGRRIDDPKISGKVTAFAQHVRMLQRLAGTVSTAKLVDAIRGEVGLDEAISPLDRSRENRNKNGHLDDLRALSALAELHDDPMTFLPWLTAALRVPNDPNGVNLSTIHKVKGLEWPHVILHDASLDVMPHRLSSDLDEERRVFHVAITRAQQSLTITADAAQPSFFLSELRAPFDPSTGVRRGGAVLPSQISGAARPQRSAAMPKKQRPTEFVVEVGDTFILGGTEHRVVEIGASGVRASIGQATTTVAFGTLVQIDGASGVLVATRSAAAGGGPVMDALKSWRLETARAIAKPAFTVFSDATLAEIAARMPSTEAELASVSGVGPTKLELYADAIFSVLEPFRI